MPATLPAVRDRGQAASDPLVALVLGWLAGKRSVHTRRAYARDIAVWLGWCAGHGTDPLTATEPDAAAWARRIEADGVAASMAGRKLSAVSSWYSWLVRNGHAGANPLTELARPDVDRDTSSTPGLTRAQALAMLSAADRARGPQRARTAALIAVILLTGARVSEVTGADIADLGTDRGHRVVHVTRKGGKRQALVLPGPAAARVDATLPHAVTWTACPRCPAVPEPRARAGCCSPPRAARACTRLMSGS